MDPTSSKRHKSKPNSAKVLKDLPITEKKADKVKEKRNKKIAAKATGKRGNLAAAGIFALGAVTNYMANNSTNINQCVGNFDQERFETSFEPANQNF